jgi:putative Holliday junction resolvase
MENNPTLAIDYGEKNFGLAISDSKGIIASPLDTLSISKNTDIQTIINDIENICQEYKVKRVVVGMPQVFEETQRKTEEKINKFLDLLRNSLNIPILTYDESFSTSEAKNMLTSSGQNFKSYKNKIDRVAATVFLQEFLNSENQKNE